MERMKRMKKSIDNVIFQKCVICVRCGFVIISGFVVISGICGAKGIIGPEAGVGLVIGEVERAREGGDSRRGGKGGERVPGRRREHNSFIAGN
jgi:hypothetical protein